MPSFDRRILAATALLIAVSDNARALTSGPNLPEYTNFESVETTDLVNLSSGNFTWSLPVMTVPGPGLGFPIVLNYHANSTQKDEASWVGLGWNIQAGSITRQVNSLPDDFKDVTILETIRSEKIYGWSHSISYNGATVGISWRSDQGYGGVIGFDMLSVINSPFSITVTEGFGSAQDQSGVSLGLRASKAIVQGGNFGLGVGASLSVGVSRGAGAYATAGAGIAVTNNDSRNLSTRTSGSLASVGVSLSQKGGLSSGATGAGVLMGTSVKGENQSQSSSFFIPLYIPGVGLFTYSNSSWSAWIQGIQDDRYFGFLYADKQGMGCTGAPGTSNCHQPTGSDGKVRRHEFMDAQRSFTSDVITDARLGKAAEDLYMVAAQGISGAFKPFRKEDGDYLNTLDATSRYVCGIDFWNECGRRTVNRTERLEIYRNLLNKMDNPITQENGDVYWRYLDDPGGAEFTDPNYRDDYASISMRSRKVVPTFDAAGKISAFTVNSSNGTVYEFSFQLRNAYEMKEGFQEGSSDIFTSQEIKSPYAYAWLLTSIKSPDYVDMDRNGLVGEPDIGGWVVFRYSDGNNHPVANGRRILQNWITPYAVDQAGTPSYALYSPSPRTNGGSVADGVAISDSRNRARGIKEIAYLHSIETPTHVALFKTKSGYREDNWPGVFKSEYIIPIGSPYYSESLTWQFIPNVEPKLRLDFIVQPGQETIPGIPGSVAENGDIVDVRLSFDAKFRSGGMNPDGASCPSSTETFQTYTSNHNINIPNVQVGQPYNVTVHLQGGMSPGYYCGSGIGLINIKRSIFPKKMSTNASKALDYIVLLEKSTNTEVAYAGFETDYSLSENTPNSRAAKHGKLALKSVRLGATSVGPFLPPYSFAYSNNPPFQSGSWVEYEKGEWDRWGNLCRTCSDSYHEPSVPFKNGRFDAGAWNLDRIVTPSGASMAVKYDAKRYQWIGNEPYAKQTATNTWELLVASGGTDAKLRDDPPYLQVHIKLDNIRNKLSERGLNPSQFRFECNLEGESNMWAFLSDEEYANEAEYMRAWGPPLASAMSHTFNYSSIGNDLWFALWLNSFSLKPIVDYKLYAIISTPPVPGVAEDFAGGTVATEIKLREPFSNTIQKLEYKYEGGVTPALPATFSNYGDARHRTGRGLEFFQGNPGVYYSKVTATVNSKNKTEYRFLTPKDLRVLVSSPTQVSAANTQGGQLSSFAVSDFSALWGSLYQKDEYSDGATPVVVRSLKSIWAYNRKQLPSDLAAVMDGEVGNLGVLEDLQEEAFSSNYYMTAYTGPLASSFKYFGQHQSLASHRYFNKNGCYGGMSTAECEQNVRTSQVVHKRFLPAISRQQSVQDGLQTETSHYFPDFKSGRMMKTRVMNSDGSALVTWKIPAYHRYSTMLDKNSLDQDFAVSTYLYPPNARTGKAYNQHESGSNAISSSTTIWRPFDTSGVRITSDMTKFQAFRIFKNLGWRVNLNAPTRPSLVVPTDNCNISSGLMNCNTAFDGDPASDWFLKEQVNRYDGFGHAIDVMDHQKINQTTLYGHRSSLPIAFIVNSGVPNYPADNKLRAFHESFEFDEDVRKKTISTYPQSQYSMSGGNFKTGAKSLKVANNAPGTMICFTLGSLEPNKEYEASVWYFDATDGSSTTSSTSTRPGIFLGENAGCASENHPNGVGGSPVAAPGSYNYDSRATGSKQWKRLSTVIRADQCSDANQLDPAIVCVYASKGNTGAAVLYDELRVRPGGSQMSTYAYDIRGRMISSADTREVTTYYEYDPHGNVTGIRNDDGVLISEQAKSFGNK